jgi:hypothetical protein
MSTTDWQYYKTWHCPSCANRTGLGNVSDFEHGPKNRTTPWSKTIVGNLIPIINRIFIQFTYLTYTIEIVYSGQVQAKNMETDKFTVQNCEKMGGRSYILYFMHMSSSTGSNQDLQYYSVCWHWCKCGSVQLILQVWNLKSTRYTSMIRANRTERTSISWHLYWGHKHSVPNYRNRTPVIGTLLN